MQGWGEKPASALFRYYRRDSHGIAPATRRDSDLSERTTMEVTPRTQKISF